MMNVIRDMPAHILAIHASGTITEDDYKNVLIPETEKQLGQDEKISMLFVLDGLAHFNFAAMWEDTKYGVKHWTQFRKIALVTDEKWVSDMTRLFIPFFPGEVKLYPMDELEDAKEWLIL